MAIGVIPSMWCNPIFRPKFRWFIWCITNYSFLIFHYYIIILINLRSAIIICLFSGDIYLIFRISLSCSFRSISGLFYCNVFEVFVNLPSHNLAIPTNNQSNYQLLQRFPEWLFFGSSFKCLCCRLLSMIKKFPALFIAQVFTYIFINGLAYTFSRSQKFITFYKNSMFSRFSWRTLHW